MENHRLRKVPAFGWGDMYVTVIVPWKVLLFLHFLMWFSGNEEFQE